MASANQSIPFVGSPQVVQRPEPTKPITDLELENLIALLRDALKQRQDEAAFKESQVTEFIETKLLFSKREAAAVLSISVGTLEQHIAAKHIKTRRIGGRVLISRQELLRCTREADALPKLASPRINPPSGESWLKVRRSQ